MKRKPTTAILPSGFRDEERINFEQLCKVAGSGPTKTNADVKAGKLPPPEWDGPKFRRWRLGDVLKALAARPREKPPGTDPVDPNTLRRRKEQREAAAASEATVAS
jgi:hypothetical protein